MTIAARLEEKGYRHVRAKAGLHVFARLKRKGKWMRGDAVVIGEGVMLHFSAQVDMHLVLPEAIAALLEDAREAQGLVKVGEFIFFEDDFDEVGARRTRRRRRTKRRQRRAARQAARKFSPKFKKKLNKIAGRIAKQKVMNQLRGAYVKVLESPVADAGVTMAAKALSAFGVPPAVTKMAINQRRYAHSDLMQHGGFAQLVADATGEKGAREVARQIARRNLAASKRALRSAIPGANLAKFARGQASKFGQQALKEHGGAMAQQLGSAALSQISGEVGYLPMDLQPTGYENAWEMGFYG